MNQRHGLCIVGSILSQEAEASLMLAFMLFVWDAWRDTRKLLAHARPEIGYTISDGTGDVLPG